MRVIVNLLLLGLWLALVVTPVVTSHWLVAGPNLLGSVAGTRTGLVKASDITILPNLGDFNGNVDFAPQGFVDGVYKDTLTLTVYPRYVANYQQVYRIYNNSGRVLRLKLQTQAPQGDTYAYSSLKAMLSTEVLNPDEKAVVNIQLVGDPAVAEYLPDAKIKLPLQIRVFSIGSE